MAYAIDLFCGAGGMSEGILQAGFDILFSSDISSDVELTYRNRHEKLGLVQDKNTYFLREDIRNLTGDIIRSHISKLRLFQNKDIPEIDAIFGGPPCQGFSRAGKRAENDPRNLLFREYIRVISEIRPRYVVMENVEGFMETKLSQFKGLNKQYRGQKLVANLLKLELKQIGYNILEPKLLNASDYGVPQRRKRAVFIAYRYGETKPCYPVATTKNNKVTVADALSDIYSHDGLLSEYQIASKQGRTPDIYGNPIPSNELLNQDISNHYKYIIERFSLLDEGENVNQLKKRIAENGLDLKNSKHLLEHIVKETGFTSEYILKSFRNKTADDDLFNILLTKKTMRSKLNTQDVSPTIVTLPDDYILPFENRVLTVREMARLQSFDDSFEFLGKRTTGGERRKIDVPQYTQVGNAVPPLLAKAIATEIIRIL